MDKDRKYLHSASVAVGVPILQAVATGIILALLALVLSIVFHAPRPWAWCGVVFVLSMAGTWLGAIRRWHSLTTFPEIQESPLTPRREYLSQPYGELTVRLVENNGQHETIARLPASMTQLQELSYGLLAGLPFSERVWSGGGKLFSLNQFRLLRSELLKRGCLTVNSGRDTRQGFQLSRPGLALMRHLSPTPPPNDLHSLDG